MDKEQKGKAAASETTAQPPQNAALLANRYYQVHSAESSQKKHFFGRFFVPFVHFVLFRGKILVLNIGISVIRYCFGKREPLGRGLGGKYQRKPHVKRGAK